MVSLPACDHLRLLDGLRELYEPRPADELRHEVLKIILSLIPADCAFYNVNDIPRRRATWFLDRPDPSLHERVPILERTMHEHPLFNHYVETGDGAPRRISDFLSRGEFHRTSIYNDFYRPQGIEFQMDMWLPHPTKQIAIGLDRADHDFSDHERLLLELFRAHLIQAIASAERMDAMREQLGRTSRHREIGELRRLGLTQRESEVLYWIAQGKTNTTIGIILDASPRTIQKHVEHIFQKLSVETRTEAAIRGVEAGLV